MRESTLTTCQVTPRETPVKSATLKDALLAYLGNYLWERLRYSYTHLQTSANIQGAEICFSMQEFLLSTEALATLFVLLLRDGVPMYQQPCR